MLQLTRSLLTRTGLQKTPSGEALFLKHQRQVYSQTDRLFGNLMIFQWLFGIMIALVVSPRAWRGSESEVHIHVWAAILLGALINIFPIYLAFKRPGEVLTRHVIAVGQMLMSALLIHLTGGRIETHFHVFGSLALLASYRDWRVLVSGTVVVAIDHLVRGLYFPQSVFGVATASNWRWLEHAGWIAFEDAFLITACVRGTREMRNIARATAEMQASERRFRSICTASPVGVFKADADGKWVYANDVWANIAGLTSRFVPAEWLSVVSPEDRPALESAWKTAVQQGLPLAEECRILRPDGTVAWVQFRSNPLQDDDGEVLGHVGTIADVSQQKAADAELRREAYHDPLTGLPNRMAFLENLSRAMARSERREQYSFAVLFMDLDRFKVVNDSLGHIVGDELLTAVADRLGGCVRNEDMVARLGGDEFVVFCDDVGVPSAATTLAARIDQCFKEIFHIRGHEIYISASIGVAFSKPEYNAPEEMLRDADLAMYRAKSSTDHSYAIFDRQMHSAAVERLEVETDLRQGIEDDQFFLVYQPIVDLETGKVSGLEALLRWMHPRRGVLGPLDFIPIAEETGLIVPLGNIALRKACSWMAKLQRQGDAFKNLSIHVNLSCKQLSQPDLLERVEGALLESGLPADSLKLEITETVIMENPAKSARLLERLRSLGVRIQIDDFGTGYSSLSYLRDLPIDALKIDRSFACDQNSRGWALINAVIVLANGLGIEVIMEGVETESQAAALRSVGCRFAQGYHFSRPVEAPAAEALVLTSLAGRVQNSDGAAILELRES